MSKWKTEATDKLFEAILTLKTLEECHLFFEDACTIKEIQAITQRFDVACKMSEGKNYQEVIKETGASSATISRVNKCVTYGEGGYKIAIDRMKEAGKI